MSNFLKMERFSFISHCATSYKHGTLLMHTCFQLTLNILYGKHLTSRKLSEHHCIKWTHIQFIISLFQHGFKMVDVRALKLRVKMINIVVLFKSHRYWLTARFYFKRLSFILSYTTCMKYCQCSRIVQCMCQAVGCGRGIPKSAA